jgi:hypothetical protein
VALWYKVDGVVMARCRGGIVVMAVAMLSCAAFAGAGGAMFVALWSGVDGTTRRGS